MRECISTKTVTLHGDDINTIEYVVPILQIVLGESREYCLNYAELVSQDGELVLFEGPADDAESFKEKLETSGLTATTDVMKELSSSLMLPTS